MATKYLIQGATTFASPAWSGGAIEDTNDLVIEYPFGQITAGLDQSALTQGLESLWIKESATSGTIGGGSYGPFIVDADNSSDAFVRNRGAVTLYIQAGGDEDLINNFDFGGASRNYLMGGTFTNVTGDGGLLSVNGSTVITNLYLFGGGGTIEYNATEITTAYIMGGNWVLKRGVNALFVGDRARVTYDPDPSVSHTGNSLSMMGGYFDLLDGAIPTVNLDAGVLDLSHARRTVALGATAFNLGGGRVIPSTGGGVTYTAVPRGQYGKDGSIPIG